MKNTSPVTLVVVFALLIASQGRAAAADAAKELIVRVMIMDNKPSINISLKGKYSITDNESARLVSEGPFLASAITADGQGIRIGKKQTFSGSARIKVQTEGNIYVNKSRFRGEVDIVRKDDSKLMLINRIDLDDYLYGVLYHEVSHRWPMEVLKAQAIAARTFALYQMTQNAKQPYDLGSDIYSQVYGGRANEKWSTNMAVNRTKGQVLAFDGKIFPAYFHATCAGRTESASNLWNIDLPPLKGAVCNYCAHSPHYRWSKEFPIWMVEEKLRMKGYKPGRIVQAEVISRTPSGRVDKMEFKDARGAAIMITGKDFRQAMGPNQVRSGKFNAQVRWGALAMEGTGWGHGVGMCQWGAFGMAKAGMKAEEILKWYYPGAEILSIERLFSLEKSAPVV